MTWSFFTDEVSHFNIEIFVLCINISVSNSSPFLYHVFTYLRHIKQQDNLSFAIYMLIIY